MKLGTQTASIMNHLHSRAVIGQPEPEVGMGATILCWTDRTPATIIEVIRTWKILHIVIQEDRAIRTDKNGMSESQTYDFTPNLEARKQRYRRSAPGKWQAVALNENTGRWVATGGNGLRIGERDKYHDFTF